MKKIFDKIGDYIGLAIMLIVGTWVCEFFTRKRVNKLSDAAELFKIKAEVEAERKNAKIKKDGGNVGVANDSADLLDD